MDSNIRTTKKMLQDRARAIEAAKNGISPEVQRMSEDMVKRWDKLGIKFSDSEDIKDAVALEKKVERLRKFSSILK